MKKKLLVLGSSLLGFALCTAVVAQAADETASEAAAPEEEEAAPQRGFYAGGSIGGSFFDGTSKGSRIFNDSTADSNGDGQPDAFTVDRLNQEDNFMWTTFVGYRMADWLGAEVGWTDIGGFRATDVNDPGNAGDPPHNNHVKPKVDGVEARLRAWVPLGTEWVSGIGGVGIFIWSQHGPKICDGPNTGACQKAPGYKGKEPPALNPRNDSGQSFTFSVGLQFKITDNVLIRTEYQRFLEVLDQDVDMVTASVVVGFYDLFGQASGGGDSFGGIVVE